MTYPFDQDADNAGKTTARRLKARIDYALDGHRTVIERDLVSGETRMLRTKGGMPEITVDKVKEKPALVAGNRTFVFKVAGAAMSAIANRAGSGLARVGAMFATATSSYFVAAWKKVATNKWNDVIRLDDADSTPPTDVKLNNAVFTGQAAVATDYQPTGIPYVLRLDGAYADAPPTAPTQSLLFVGEFESGFMGVRNILKTGAVGKAVTISRPDIPVNGHSAGLRVKPDGTFLLYGGFLSKVSGGNYLQPYVATTTWSEIKVTASPPFIYENAHHEQGARVEETEVAITLTFPEGYSSSTTTHSYAGPLPNGVPDSPSGDVYSTSYTPHDYHEYQQNYGQHTTREIAGYGYAGSEIEMTFRSSLDVQNYSSWESFGVGRSSYADGSYYDPVLKRVVEFPYALSDFVSVKGPLNVNFEARTYFELVCAMRPSKKLYEVTWTQEARSTLIARSGLVATSTGLASCTIPLPDAPHHDRNLVEIKTRDYLYADIDEDIYITLESSMYGGHQQNFKYDYLDDGWWTVGDYRAKFVVSVRGAETEFPIDWVVPTSPAVVMAGVFTTEIGAAGIPADGGGVSYPDIGKVYLGYMPIPIFNPMFMNQGNCPYIAYTTKAEELGGATPEFYLDFPITLNRYQTVNTPNAFTPFQFLTAYYKHIQMANGGTTNAQYQETAWDDWMFVKPIRLQMCNGIKGPWADKIGPEFSGNPQLDISRI